MSGSRCRAVATGSSDLVDAVHDLETGMTLLFETIHGSHLYGCARPDSDRDSFRVYTNETGRVKARTIRQTIVGGDDVIECDLSTFVLYAGHGVPQFLEAMYSTVPTTDLLGEAYRFSFRPDAAGTRVKYAGFCAKSWEMADRLEARGDMVFARKKRRHAHRLGLAMESIERGLRFDPTLTAAEWERVHANLHRHPFEVWPLIER